MKKTFLALVATAALATPQAEAALILYTTALAPEVPGATGSGVANVLYDDVAHTFEVSATFSGLSGPTTVAHIHCCTAVAGTGTVGVAVTPGTLPGFPTGVTSGTYLSPVLDLTLDATYTAGFRTNFGGGTAAGSETAIINGILAGTAHFNVHSSTFPGGEIRGFLAVSAVPEPTSLSLVALGLAGAMLLRRRQRS